MARTKAPTKTPTVKAKAKQPVAKLSRSSELTDDQASETDADEQAEQAQPRSVEGIDTDQLVTLLDQWAGESSSFWDKDKDYNLKKSADKGEELYLGRQVKDNEDPNDSLDNRIFSSVRTIVPYVTSRITEPEVYPSSSSVESKKFAEDFEKALHIHAQNEDVKSKAKFALEDAIIRKRGYLKLRYDGPTNNFCSVEYVPAESIIIDHKATRFDEPRFFRHILDTTVDKLLLQFPEAEASIKNLFNIDEHTPLNKYHDEHKVNEDWIHWRNGNEMDLLVVWSYNGHPIAAIQDPNWRYDDANFLQYHMIPLIPFNVLNDGRKWIDRTSFIEQARFLQGNVDKRAKQINKGAGLGSTGMPVVDAEAIDEEEEDQVTFDEDQTLVLTVPDGKNINDVFTKWQSNPLPGFLFDDKLDNRTAIDNVFGTSNITRGEQSDNNTLGQDVLLRDQSQGRQQEILDAMDSAMARMYKLIAQFMLVYGDAEEMFRYVGEDSEFDYIIMDSSALDTKAEIRIKAGTSMPIDKAQRRATANNAAQYAMIDPLTYWEIMDEPNAQKYAKRLIDYTADPGAFLKDTQDELFNRDAYVDIEIVKQGGVPPYRDNLDQDYFKYLTQFVTSGALENPKLAPEVAAALTNFINMQNQRAAHMLGMAETQLPTPQDVNDHNAQIDAQNQADAAALKGAGSAPAAGGMSGSPGLPGQPGVEGRPKQDIANPAGASPTATPPK